MVLVLLLVFLLLKFMVFLLLEVFQVVQLAAGVVVVVGDGDGDGDGDVVVVVVAIVLVLVLVLLPLLLLSPSNPMMILMSQIPFLLLPLQGQLEFILSSLYSGAP